jgi:hypothetical protein
MVVPQISATIATNCRHFAAGYGSPSGALQRCPAMIRTQTRIAVTNTPSSVLVEPVIGLRAFALLACILANGGIEDHRQLIDLVWFWI